MNILKSIINNSTKIIIVIYVISAISFVITKSEISAGLVIMGCSYFGARFFQKIGCFVTSLIFYAALLYTAKELILLFF